MHNIINKLCKGQVPVIELKDCERQPCEIWTRVMGYFRPVSEFNKGKKAEFYSRQYFTEQKAILPSIRAESETDTQVRNKHLPTAKQCARSNSKQKV